ncbi:MAG: type II toxin-antitoxin system RelE/ParE family toxin [Syntrophomonas sp.]|uniref:type II toxin-antitoxin system RelE/ParE family toxin n=1 Tax=Syntrophomonas sp. TaxID=2053627 RepID=UPI00260B2744|nr:type II toxin-antitoxin system RelE/ParE family toxin [Syntrophomonas sp.]MDD4627293.1 type II toxin-antitoxin system RelE/ParE family toxin [Syntrophomonas sp.]
MYEITYLPIAEQDIAEIIIYISNQLKAPKAAIELLDAFDHSIFLLQEFPYAHKIYRLTKPLEEEYRLLPVKNYAVFYVVREQDKSVEVQRVVYAKMDLSQILK